MRVDGTPTARGEREPRFEYAFAHLKLSSLVLPSPRVRYAHYCSLPRPSLSPATSPPPSSFPFTWSERRRPRPRRRRRWPRAKTRSHVSHEYADISTCARARRRESEREGACERRRHDYSESSTYVTNPFSLSPSSSPLVL